LTLLGKASLRTLLKGGVRKGAGPSKTERKDKPSKLPRGSQKGGSYVRKRKGGGKLSLKAFGAVGKN